jgi:UMF1 family MFS transporter
MTDASDATSTPRKGLIGWALYDWANSPYTTLIITFVFAAYFSQGIVGDKILGQELWGYTASIAGLIIALGSPVFGAIADAGGPRKPWLLAFTAICAVGSWMLWYAEPNADFTTWAMVWVVIATVGFEFGIVFNNAMLPDLVPESRLGRWSGWAWGLGYFGGLAAMVLALVGFVQAEVPLFGLSKDGAEHVRMVGPLAAIWIVAFSWPMFLWTPDRVKAPMSVGAKVSQGFASLIRTLREVRRHGNIVRFLIARMIYADGLVTLFAFGGIYAAGTFGMELAEVITFGIVLNVTSGVGAICFAWIDDWIGSKKTILIALVGLVICALGAVMVSEVMWFWIWGSLLGIFVGPAQAASRSLMARLSPADKTTEFFGLYALTGKATAFIGPALVAVVTAAMQSQRWGLAVVIAFFAVGLLLLLTVREEKSGF